MARWVCPALLALTIALSGCSGARLLGRAETAVTQGDFESAAALWRVAARRGDPEAMYRLGSMLSVGQGVNRDQKKAVRWFRRAADRGHTDAQTKLGHVYMTRQGNPERDPNAERWLRRTAMKGSADTRYRLAVLYFEGEIVGQDTDEAMHWFRKSTDKWPLRSAKQIDDRLLADDLLQSIAELGLPEAQHRMGRRFANGNGVPQSRTEALKWYYLAANQGLARAQISLAAAYCTAQGVSRDLPECARWFLKAANQGDPDAQFEMGSVYEYGQGVRKDAREAHFWYNLAAAQGHLKARKRRNEISDKLVTRDLWEAEERAVEFMAALVARTEAEAQARLEADEAAYAALETETAMESQADNATAPTTAAVADPEG